MNKKILISTGGSGGHVVPATIFYDHLKIILMFTYCPIKEVTQFLNKEKYNIEIINTPKLSKNLFLLPFQILLMVYLTMVNLYFF